MKTFLTLLVLLFSSSVLAEDISDFQIEGISIGDSLLDYLSKDEIENKREFFTKNKKPIKEYSKTFITNKNKLSIYDSLYIYFKSKDKKYIVQSLSGRIYFQNKIDECYSLQKEIVEDIREFTKNAKEIEYKGKLRVMKGVRKQFRYLFEDDSTILIACYDYEEKNLKDRLSVVVASQHYTDFQKRLFSEY